MMSVSQKATHRVKAKADWSVFCQALYEALLRSEEFCRQQGLRFEAAALKLDLERELDLSL